MRSPRPRRLLRLQRSRQALLRFLDIRLRVLNGWVLVRILLSEGCKFCLELREAIA